MTLDLSPSRDEDSPFKRLCASSGTRPKRHNSASGKEEDRDSLKDLSNFHRLPVELQVEIFVHCLASYPRFFAHEAPLLLCHVCTSWKSLALSTPKLWASFEIEIQDIGVTDRIRDRRLMNMMKTWLSRSRNYPLSFRLLHGVNTRTPDTITADLLTALIPQAHRWHHVHLSLPSSSIVPIQETLPNAFGTLRSLAIELKGLWYSIVPIDIQALAIPWGRLTRLHLCLDYLNLLVLDECLDILSQAVNLRDCTINADCVFGMEMKHPRKVILPMLTRFHLIVQGGVQTYHNGVRITEKPELCLISFLSALEFVQLQTLNIEWLIQWDNDESHWSEIHTQFVFWLRDFARTMETLRFSYLPLDEEDIMDCLDCLPMLRQLDLRFTLGDNEPDPITDRLLRTYTLPPPAPPILLNHLERVTFQCHGVSLTNSSLINFIQSRLKTEDPARYTQLKAFRFSSMKPVSEDLIPHIKRWIDEGLDIKIDTVTLR